MAKQKYAIEGYNLEHMAKAIGRSLPISTKYSVEVCSFIRGKNLQKAKKMLNEVIALKTPVPFKRYNRSIGHKTGKLSVGRYPVNASRAILSILESAEANAQFKGLNTSNLVIKHICAHKASNQPHYGRQRGRMMKRTHIEVVLQEKAGKAEEKKEAPKKVGEKPKKEAAPEKKEEPKKEVKAKPEEKSK